MARPAARVGHDPRRVRGGVAAPTGARRGAAVSQRRRRHVAGGDELGGQPEATSSPHCGSPRRYPSASSASDARSSPHCSSDSDPESNRGSWGTPTPRSGTSRSSRAIGRHHPNPTRPPPSSSCSRGPHGTPRGPRISASTPAWGTGDLTKADALVRQAIDGFRSDGDTMGLGYALSDAALLTTDLDEAQRLAAEADELLRATGSPIGHRPHRRMARDHRLRPG